MVKRVTKFKNGCIWWTVDEKWFLMLSLWNAEFCLLEVQTVEYVGVVSIQTEILLSVKKVDAVI